MGWLFLALAIVLELSGTVSMKLSDSFTRLVPSVLMFAFYGASFTFLNFALGYMKVSTVYAVWSGGGHRADFFGGEVSCFRRNYRCPRSCGSGSSSSASSG